VWCGQHSTCKEHVATATDPPPHCPFPQHSPFYSYAAAFAAAVWQKLFAADPLSRTAGETYWREVLAHGSAADPAGVLIRVLGGPPTLRPLLQELGVLQPLTAESAQAVPQGKAQV
jgi:hypothetical protein